MVLSNLTSAGPALRQEMHKRPPDVPSDLNNSLTLQFKSLFLNDKARLVLNALPTWPGRSPGQGLSISPCVYELSLFSDRSSRPCLNTNNNNKVKGKNYLSPLTHVTCFFTANFSFGGFQGYGNKSKTCPNVHFHART